ncbi:putative DNA-directed RNA polymerase beta subunit [Erwinia phage vB_EamM_Kwan]|uniref:Putative DNA-directed RNA polymerase beta subunit n=1 Tax=Erwinia phage vB_EamM_Kwan TaxID=1883374 RepID=A0A1B2IEE8_9CAUD|nr:RNA polymerase beta subunit [Erwinia phage vB_EamM_Kwan]ANZ49619.1 putative DNA-directed RNA polymerase beta subunit [Erwinia phage vB_EamM_Kwan]
MLQIRQFNQHFSIRKTDEYSTPRIIPLEKLQIPRGSVLHTVDLDQVVLAPPSTLPYFKELTKPAQVRHHYRLATDGITGKPIPVPVQGQERAILAYHRENRTFRRMQSDELVRRDDLTLLIENYTPLLPHYRYADTLLSWYDRLHNVVVTIAEQMKYDTNEYTRQNYYILNVGSRLPAFEKFKNTYNDRIKTRLEHFQTFDLQWLLELFAWAHGEQELSVFAGMDFSQLSRMNFIITHNTGFTVMNMGVVERMRKDSGGRFNDDMMARKFHKLIAQVLTRNPDPVADIDFVSPSGDEATLIESAAPQGNIDGLDDEADLEDAEITEDDDHFDEKADLVIQEKVEDVKPTTITVEKAIDHGQIIKNEVARLAEAGRLSVKAFTFLNESSERFVSLPNPYDKTGKETYGDALKYTEADLKVEAKTLVKNPTVMTEAWTQNTTDAMTKKYNRTMLPKDILGAVASSQRLGLVVHNHTVDKEVAVTGNVEHHTLRLQPVGGEPVTVRFSVPSLTEDGTWMANGTEYTMRRQRVDIPIRKVNFDTVALTTAYGKNFVSRSEKAVNDYGRWITNAIITRAVDPKNTEITDAKLANVFNPELTLPRQYTMVARRVSTFNAIGYRWNFEHAVRDSFFGEAVVKDLEKKDLVPVATGRGGVLGMDEHSQVYRVKGDTVEPLGSLADTLGIDQVKAPREVSELSIMGQSLSLGFVFSFYLGLTGMLKHFGIRYEVLPPGQRVDKTTFDSVIRLADAKIVVMCDNDKQRMVVNGLDKYLKHLVMYTESEVEREDIYLNLIRDADSLTPRYVNELKQMRSAFVDDMHARILRQMGEPETFIGLLERSNELLQTDHSKPEINGDEMMFVGNQRIAYHVYTALVRAMRNYQNAPGSSRKFELPQDMVWGAINSDPSVLLAPGANPIQNIKEKDVITMGGTGGRNRKTMVYHTREFQPSDLGVVSGNTVDNGDVGITAFSTANPCYATVDGITAPRNVKDLQPGQLLSFIDGLAPDTLMDDAKRQNFVGIQWGSAMACVGATTLPYRTEMEKLVAHRTSVKHARVAEQAGKVLEVSEDHIKIKYDDGSEVSFELGRWFGAHEGSNYPHTLITDFKVGDKFPEGTVVTFNEQHFERDLMDRTQVNLKNGIVGWMALIEGEEVIEDSNAISAHAARLMAADVTKAKEVTVRFDQNIMEILKEGDHVDVDSILCTFNDQMSDDSASFSEESAATLYGLSAYAPQAGLRGFIDKIEVVYHGDIEDMSPSITSLVQKYDRVRKKRATALSKDDVPTSGSVNGDYRVDGVPLAYQNAVIKFYITHRVDMAAADKLVLANQLKTTVYQVMPGENHTEAGDLIDFKFGRTSVDARIVGSVIKIGTTNGASLKGGEWVGRILEGEAPPKLPSKV